MNQELPKENDPIIQEYREFVQSLECTKNEDLKTRLDHAITGIGTEAGELLELIKKVKFYHKETPRIRFLDEASGRVGCLVHAELMPGPDLRRHAFPLVPTLGCNRRLRCPTLQAGLVDQSLDAIDASRRASPR